jgi:hypothetical protein
MASALGGGSSGDKKDLTAKNETSIKNAMSRLGATGTSTSALSHSYGATGDQDFKDQLLSKLSPLMNTADSVLNVVERPFQANAHALQQFSGQGTKALSPEVLKAAFKAYGKGLTDVKGEDNLNLRATVNQDPNVGGRGAGLIDTIGSAAIDPLSFVSAGGGAVGKVGMKIIEKELGEATAKQVARKGIKSLGEEEQAAVRKAILESDQAAAKEASKAGGAQNLLDQITGSGFKAGALEDGNGLKFAGKTVIPGEALRPAAEALHLPQAAEALKTSKAGTLARHAFQPLARAEDALGKKTAEAVDAVLRRGRAQADMGATDASTQARALIKESKVPLKELREGTTPRAQEVINKIDSVWRDAAAGRDDAVAKAKSTDISSKEAAIQLPNMQAVFDPKFPGAGRRLADEKIIPGFSGTAEGQKGIFEGSAHEQLGRSITTDALKAINKNPTAIARALHLDASATPTNIIQHIQNAFPNRSLEEANAEIAQALGVKHAFELNPVKALTDQTVKAHREAAVADTLKGLMDIKGEDGLSVISTEKFPGAIERNTVLGKVYGTKEVLDLMDHAAVTLTDDEALKALGGIIDKWGKLWRGYATVPTLFGLGFHERNLVGNVFNMWLGGFRAADLPLFKNADKIGRAIESGTNKGATIDEAIENAKSLSPEERHYVRLAYKEGVIGDSFFRTDQATTAKGSFKEATIGGKIDKTIGLEGPILKTGTYVGRRIEDNSRLAFFMSQMRKHGDPSVAAEEVKKALFDYSELTPTEQRIKKVVPFYTYMRKNTPLQLKSLVGNPGKASNLAHFRDNMQAGAPEIDGKPVPQYALQGGAIPLFGGDTPIVGSMATPFQAAFQQIQPLLELASQAPGAPKGLKSEGGSGKAIRELLGNVGGGPLDLVKFGVEQATGKSLLTGSDLPQGTGGKRLAKSLVPLVGKGDSTYSDLTSGDDGVRNARLLAALSGLSTTALTEKSVGGETSRRARVLQGETKGLETMAELRKAGKVPKAKKAKSAKPHKVVAKKTPTQKATAARKAAATKAHKKKTT